MLSSTSDKLQNINVTTLLIFDFGFQFDFYLGIEFLSQRL
jgi:hypothetical protein